MKSLQCPFADRVIGTAHRLRRSFHALPLSGSASLRGSAFKHRYKSLFDDRLASELSVAAPFLDCLISPEGSLAEAEGLAAEGIGADTTLFTTCGTTISNGIVMRSLLAKPDVRVLADRMLHQSLHFSLGDRQARVDYVPTQSLSDAYDVACVDLDGIKQMLIAAEAQDDPYELIVINGQTYEGVVCHIGKIVDAVIDCGASVRRLMVDEAWGAASAYHPDLRKPTAMAAAQSAIARNNGFCIVSTQSAHKSLSALRQGSFIHVSGDRSVARSLANHRYQSHTTSASSTILASLDLACAQARAEGAGMLERSIGLADHLKKAIQGAPLNHAFDCVDLGPACNAHNHIEIDPTKVMIRSRLPGVDGKKLRKLLFVEFGIYVSRTIGDAVLVNLHIGIHGCDIDHLISALSDIADAEAHSSRREGSICDGYIIAYPPGVPLAVPGEIISSTVMNRMRAAQQDGSSIISVA